MESISRNVWKGLSRLFPADESASAQAAQLFREYESAGYLKRPIARLLSFELPIIADFFRRMALMHSSESPILRRRDTRWMSEFDYTLVNVRAAGTESRPGTFLSAAMFLASLRTQGIILAPATRGPTPKLNILESHALFRSELADHLAVSHDVSAETQAMAFCEAAHLLGLVLGFELDYRVDRLATVVLNRPELFFWTHNNEFIPDEKVQDSLRDQVRTIVASLSRAGASVERYEYAAALDAKNLATKPSNDGSGRTDLALKFVENGSIGEHRDAAVAYWGRVFDLWRDRFGFDFLVLRGTQKNDDDNPTPPDRFLIRKAAEAARKGGVRKNIGVVADGDGFEVESYGVQGVDLVLENDSESKADREWFQRTLSLDEQLRRVNLGRKLRFSVPLAVDPGDKESLSRRERAHIRRFVARFLGTGPARRPLLETMGASEGAWGYHSTLEKAIPMGWMPDVRAAEICRNIEDVALAYSDMLKNGERLDKHVDSKEAWWVIRSRWGLLIAIVSVENENLLPPERLRIDYSSYIKGTKSMSVLEHDFQNARGLLRLSTNSIIDISGIPYRGFRLFVIT